MDSRTISKALLEGSSDGGLNKSGTLSNFERHLLPNAKAEVVSGPIAAVRIHRKEPDEFDQMLSD